MSRTPRDPGPAQADLDVRSDFHEDTRTWLQDRMKIALCYESVLPARGGCETYIGDLSRRLARDGHEVLLFACRWDPAALPAEMQYHRLDVAAGPRFLRPWRFARACEYALRDTEHDVSVGFDKTWGQDILYPQGGLHVASRASNRLKHSSGLIRTLADLGKTFDPAVWSFTRLERKQYLGPVKPIVLVNSRMVQGHFKRYYNIGPDVVRVLPSAIDPLRFAAEDRVQRRQAERRRWRVTSDLIVGLFIAMNYRLKGLAPLIRGAAAVPAGLRFKIAVVGHPNFRAYETLAHRLGVSERFLFLGHRNDPRDAYFAADFLVHPTFYDPCSLVVLEALACGLPVITTRFNGASELLDVPDNGVVVQDPHDAVELARALEQMQSREYLKTAAASARSAAQNWTFEHHYKAMLKVMQEAAARKRQAAPC